MNLPLEYYGYTGWINVISVTLFAVFIYSRKPDSRMVRLYCIFCASVVLWAFFYSLFCMNFNPAMNKLFLRTCMMFVPFIATTFFHFTTEFVQKKIPRGIHILNHGLALIWASSTYTDLFAIDVSTPPPFVFPYWPQPTILFHLSLAHFLLSVNTAFFLLILKILKTPKGEERAMYWVFFWGCVIGFPGGSSNFLVWYRFPLPPVINPLVSMIALFPGYAIIRYKLFEIELFVKRTIIFAGLSLTILIIVGIISYWLPSRLLETFGLQINPFWLNIISVAIVASSFNRIREFLANSTDKYLFQKAPDYRGMLRRFTDQVLEISDLRQIIQLTVMTVSESMRVSSCSLWIKDPETMDFVCEALRGSSVEVETLRSDNPLCKLVNQNPTAIGLEDNLGVHSLTNDVIEELVRIKGRFCIPLTHQNETTGLLLLGKKMSDEAFTVEDIDMIKPLTGTLAMAISNARLFTELAKKETEAATDELTGLYMRREFLKQARLALASAATKKESCSLLMIDLDHFKQKNDTYGHLTGDLVLQETAHRLTQTFRQNDLLGRYGGEEFILFLPGMSKQKAAELADRMRENVAAKSIRTPQGDLKQTISVGLAGFPMDGTTLESLIEKADKALYQAKEGGRNRVMVV